MQSLVENRISSRYADLSTGVRLHYVEQGDSRNRDGVIIFLHGYSDSWRSFERTLPLLPDDFRALAVDHRGHGDSSKPTRGYSQAEFAADVAAFMDALGIPRASIVGHSMGSLIAHKFAVEYPSRVERLVLAGSAATAKGNPNVIELDRMIRRFTDEIPRDFIHDFQASTFAGERGAPNEVIRTFVSESLKVPARVWRQAMDGMLEENHTAELARIASPTLILFGDRDGIFSYEENLLLASLIPRSTFIYYFRDEESGVAAPGHTGHSLHVEWPEEFVRDLVAFME